MELRVGAVERLGVPPHQVGLPAVGGAGAHPDPEVERDGHDQPDAPPLLEPEEAVAPLLPVSGRDGTGDGCGPRASATRRHGQRGQDAEDEEQQDLRAQHRCCRPSPLSTERNHSTLVRMFTNAMTAS